MTIDLYKNTYKDLVDEGNQYRVYTEASDKDFEANKRRNVRAELKSIVQARTEELDLVQSWEERAEFSKSKNSASAERLVRQVVDMVYAYYYSLSRFAHIEDFSKISLCALFVEQLEVGGLPCGWLSKTEFWDLTELKSHIDYEKGYPKLHHGVFNDPTDKLAMLYID